MITHLVLLAENMTPRFLRCSGCSNISVILALLFLMVFPKIQKHRSLAVATLAARLVAFWPGSWHSSSNPTLVSQDHPQPPSNHGVLNTRTRAHQGTPSTLRW